MMYPLTVYIDLIDEIENVPLNSWSKDEVQRLKLILKKIDEYQNQVEKVNKRIKNDNGIK